MLNKLLQQMYINGALDKFVGPTALGDSCLAILPSVMNSSNCDIIDCDVSDQT